MKSSYFFPQICTVMHTMDNIAEILKRKIDQQIYTFVKHKASKKAFNNYINSLENDKTKLKNLKGI